ncbi:H-NS family nucleoid-associated regulatory protein [Caballeronia sp. SBC2]|uniref:H-NS family nucleoid-associated regulatory protein n=1 Tax=Caballeronia sp. SBC2 TaxID=2705547 RepID=UPI0013E122AD|nr:H-NS family nucleoid-associated regulatory protein [Caballeronia sp. SBC2]QIE22913.1 H-NS histone family protein [Caballeronia sp. SBC2]
MATLESLQAKIRKLEQQAEALIAKQVSGVIEKIRKLMAEHGLTTADISTQVGGKRLSTKFAGNAVSKSNVAVAKYHDPKTGATWTGHGRAPNWIATAKNRDKFLVDASAATVKPAPVSKAKAAGKYVRGPQPAMYRNPKSGATWTGRGRAPAWIADAKDRAKFLIASGADAGRAASVSPVSKAGTAVKSAAADAGAVAHKGQRKGPQPAKYLAPKTGATWSGRGPAPAWLAAAKDRTKFLIADAGSADAGSANVAGKNATAKKAAAKKAVASKPAAKKATAKKADIA